MSDQESAQIDEEQFIRTIRKFPELYDLKSREYKSANKKRRIWQTLSEQFNIDAKKTWRTFKDLYMDEKRKILLGSHLVNRGGSRWPMFKQMSFLDGETNGDTGGTSSTDESDISDSEDIEKADLKRKLDDAMELVREATSQNERIGHLRDEDKSFMKTVMRSMKRMKPETKTIFKVSTLLEADSAIKNDD